MLMQNRSTIHWALASAAVFVVAYSLVVLVIVATAPDLRLRWLLVDSSSELTGPQSSHGVLIRKMEGAAADGPLPEPGDRLIRLGGEPIVASVDAAWRILSRVPPPSVTLSWTSSAPTPEPSRVMVEYWSAREQRQLSTRLIVQAVPAFEIGLTLVWFVCQLAILGLGAVAFWNRPFDRHARLFFAMCVVTLGAFVGGYHWWLLSGSALLSLPFVVCALLLPSVTLHFFLAYPRPKSVLIQWHNLILWGLYGPPVLAAFCFLVTEGVVWWHLQPSLAPGGAAVYWLRWLRTGIYGYLPFAAGCFLATMVSLGHSVITTRQLLERQQVLSILWAALISSLFIGYTLVLAVWDRAEFALGGARIPMFLSSLMFMAAYAVGIVRYKLMQTDDARGRGTVVAALRFFGAVLVGGAIIPLAIQVGHRTVGLPWIPSLTVTVVLLVVTVFVATCRDYLQHWLERRLFRERFRLEKALQRIHRAVGQLADPKFLSERTLVACNEVLQAEWAALYLREVQGESLFRLSGAEGREVVLPLNWAPSEDFLKQLEFAGGIVSAYGDRRTESRTLLEGMAELGGELVHLLEIDGEAAGLVVLGPKLAGRMYSEEDGTFLTALAQLTGVALHCVRVHQDLTQLNEQLRMKVERIAQQRQQILLLQAELAATRPPATVPAAGEFCRDAIKGASPAMAEVLETARKASASDATVLVRGESGTGKELIARAIHENSPRRHGPLVTVHCAALAPSLLESELFGHVKGAFTGATTDRRGRIELANSGTLFLDEIGELSPETQVKLLRVLQQREVEPVGSGTAVSVDVRIVAATHRNLEQMIADGRFREDLYYRLNVVMLRLPSLRERREDIQELAAEFLRRAAEKCDKQVVDFEEPALDALMSYEWPGNIRELENVIERAVVLSEGSLVTAGDLPSDLVQGTGATLALARGKAAAAGRISGPVAGSAVRSKSPVGGERQQLLEALRQAGGNKAQAAKLLGLPRSTLFSKLKKYAITD